MSQIFPMMTGDEIEEGIETLITPEYADEQVPILVRFIYEVANFEEPAQANQAKKIALAAFRRTTAYANAREKAFRQFVLDSQMPEMISEQNNADELQQTASSAVH